MVWKVCGGIAWVGMIVPAGLGGWAVATGQEPAFFYNNGGIRYEGAQGVYHYVFPCKIRDSKAADAAIKFDGICWPVFGTMVLNEAGSGTPEKPVAGILLVSPAVVHFEPVDQANPGSIPDMKPGEIQFKYFADKSVAALGTGLGTVLLKLRGVCEGCKPGPARGIPQAQVDGEYAELKDGLSDYASLAKRMKERSAFLEVAIAPKTEPGLEDVAEAMGVYAALNEKLAPMCGESARACVQQFSTYETCKKGDLKAECGVAPGCETTCTLTEAGFRSLNATWCRAPKDKASVLIPDWSAAGEKLRAQQKAWREKNAGAALQPLSPVPAGKSAGQVDFMGRPVDPSTGCSVEQGYANAMMMASTRDVFGQAGAFPAGHGTRRVTDIRGSRRFEHVEQGGTGVSGAGEGGACNRDSDPARVDYGAR